MIEIERRKLRPDLDAPALLSRHFQHRLVGQAVGNAAVSIERAKKRQPGHQDLAEDVFLVPCRRGKARFGLVQAPGQMVENAGSQRADGDLHEVAHALELGHSVCHAEPGAFQCIRQRGAAQRGKEFDPGEKTVLGIE